jgi:hypothetical protein
MFQQRAPATRSGLLPTTPPVSAGLADIFTPVSSGQVNINTCSATTLRMLGMDEATAERIISLRQGPDSADGAGNNVPFSNPGEIINAGLPAQLAQQFLPYLTVRSSTFEVQVDVEVGSSHRRYYALLRRNTPRDIQILTLHWE